MGKKKILIIDDEEGFAQLVKFNLEKNGDYIVRVETKGKEALAVAQEFKPGIIFLDVIMPDMDGGQAAYQIKADSKLKDIPIVFLTGLVNKDEIVTRNDVIGKYEFIPKPISTEKLIDCIKRHIDKK